MYFPCIQQYVNRVFNFPDEGPLPFKKNSKFLVLLYNDKNSSKYLYFCRNINVFFVTKHIAKIKKRRNFTENRVTKSWRGCSPHRYLPSQLALCSWAGSFITQFFLYFLLYHPIFSLLSNSTVNEICNSATLNSCFPPMVLGSEHPFPTSFSI